MSSFAKQLISAGIVVLGGIVSAAAQDNPPPSDRPVLRVLAHDFFSVDEDVLSAFEEAHGVKVEIVGAGDANEVMAAAIATAGDPDGDILFGVDNLVYRRAVDADVFVEYAASDRQAIPEGIRAQFDNSLYVTPIDYGFVTINWDKAAEGEPPVSFRELTEPTWRGSLVVEDPALSSPGLQFLLTTIAYFGEAGDYRWQDFWADLKANDVLVADDWGEAYAEHFSARGGDRPLVVSYTTSPAAEVHFSDGALDEPPIANVILGPLFRQVEAVGILRGTGHPELARAFVDYMLTDRFQAQIPSSDHVYPVIPGLPMPEWWRWADVEVEVAELDVTQAEIDAWVAEWQAIMQ